MDSLTSRRYGLMNTFNAGMLRRLGDVLDMSCPANPVMKTLQNLTFKTEKTIQNSTFFTARVLTNVDILWDWRTCQNLTLGGIFGHVKKEIFFIDYMVI